MVFIIMGNMEKIEIFAIQWYNNRFEVLFQLPEVEEHEILGVRLKVKRGKIAYFYLN